MVRSEESLEERLRNTSPKCSSLETSRRTPGFDIPMSTPRPNGKCRTWSVGLTLIAVAAIVSVCAVTLKIYEQDDSKRGNIRIKPQNIARAPGPHVYAIFGAGHGCAISPPAPTVQAAVPTASPLTSSLSAVAPVPLSRSSYSDLAPYESICNKTIDRAACLDMFRDYPDLHEGMNLRQSIEMAMRAAERALNDSYTLAEGMKKPEGNPALQQCVDVFADALFDVNTSMSLVAAMDDHNPGSTRADVQTFMSAAMTNQDTCQEGIDDVGPFPGSDQITGSQAKRVNTMLSIALTFANQLSSPTKDLGHHRRLLRTESARSQRISNLGRRRG